MSMHNNISTKLKEKRVIDKNNTKKTEAMIKKRV